MVHPTRVRGCHKVQYLLICPAHTHYGRIVEVHGIQAALGCGGMTEPPLHNIVMSMLKQEKFVFQSGS
jgi:hypothetical protein